jgi:hypothetical protein
MNNRIKVRVSKGELAIEVEGDAEIVIRHLDEIKKKVWGEISLPESQSIKVIKEEQINEPAPAQESFNDTPPPPGRDIEYAPLKNVVLKQLPGVELEWVLIYAFYDSNFGKNKFNRDTLLLKYRETDRASDSRKSNLFNNIRTLVRKNWARALNDTDFLLTEAGIKKSKEILKRTVPGKQRKVSKRKPVVNNQAVNPGNSP